jgi:aspartyl-tRNA(Asn)/glutamyl-tRNA(Gln) amidotransferase subunit C
MSEQLTRADVLKVANLARLKLSEAEVEQFTSKLGQLLEYFSVLNDLETGEVDEMVHAVELSNVFREDVVRPSLERGAALANAPKSDGKFFLVPQILEG